MDGIKCEADPRGNPQAWAETVHSTCPSPRVAGYGTQRRLWTAKVQEERKYCSSRVYPG